MRGHCIAPERDGRQGSPYYNGGLILSMDVVSCRVESEVVVLVYATDTAPVQLRAGVAPGCSGTMGPYIS